MRIVMVFELKKYCDNATSFFVHIQWLFKSVLFAHIFTFIMMPSTVCVPPPLNLPEMDNLLFPICNKLCDFLIIHH